MCIGSFKELGHYWPFIILFIILQTWFSKTILASYQKREIYTVFRYIDLILLGITSGALANIIFDGDDGTKSSSHFLDGIIDTSSITLTAWLLVSIGSLLVYAFRFKGWLPKITSIATWHLWPPIYVAIIIGSALSIIPKTLSANDEPLLNLLLLVALCISSIILAELFSALYIYCEPRKYEHEDSPIKSLKDDLMNREFIVKELYQFWSYKLAPKSGFLLGAFGAGKTSIVNMTEKYCIDNNSGHYVITPISLWGYSERNILEYVINTAIKSLNKIIDISSLYGFGNSYSQILIGTATIIEKLKGLFPENINLSKIDALLTVVDKRLILVFEDIDREFPFSQHIDTWDLTDRHKLHQIEQLIDQLSGLQNIAIWITISPVAMSMISAGAKRYATEFINLDDYVVNHGNNELVSKWMQKTGLVI